MSLLTRAEKKARIERNKQEPLLSYDRQRFIDQISLETTEFLSKNTLPCGKAWKGWPSAEAAILGAMQFTKRRIKHYGLKNRYLPPTFKRQPKQNGDNPIGPTDTLEGAVQSG